MIYSQKSTKTKIPCLTISSCKEGMARLWREGEKPACCMVTLLNIWRHVVLRRNWPSFCATQKDFSQQGGLAQRSILAKCKAKLPYLRCSLFHAGMAFLESSAVSVTKRDQTEGGWLIFEWNVVQFKIALLYENKLKYGCVFICALQLFYKSKLKGKIIKREQSEQG